MNQFSTYQSTFINDNQVIISNGQGSCRVATDIDDAIQFLLQEDYSPRLAWSLDEFVAPILRLLHEHEIINLANKHKCTIPPYNIFYIPKKIFTITDIRTCLGVKEVSFYDLKQYFPDGNNIDAQENANKLAAALDTMGIKATKLTSPIKIYEESYMKGFSLPSINCIPDKIKEISKECAGKLWIQAYKIGRWEEAYDYDIRSAFPTIMKELQDIRYGAWYRIDDINVPQATYGYCKGKVHIHDHVAVHPIMKNKPKSRTRPDKNSWFTPVGSWETTLTKEEIAFIYYWNIGSFEVYEGWWFIPDTISHNSYLNKPFKKPIEKLLQWKDHENPIVQLLAKRMAVGMYGKMLETYSGNKNGKFYNPVYGAEISSRIRLECANFIYRHTSVNNLIHVYVDGILLDKEV